MDDSKNNGNIPLPEETQIPKSSGNIKGLHTYESDMARALRDNNGSLVKISLAEQKKKEEEGQRTKLKKEHSRNFMYVIGGVVLLAIVFFSARYVNTAIKNRSVNQTVIEKRDTFFNIENQTVIPASFIVGKEASAKAILATLKEKSVPGEMSVIFFKKDSTVEGEVSYLSTQEIIQRLSLSIPGSLVRTLDPDTIVGGYKDDTNQNVNLFLLWNTSDYDRAFAGMLEWESNLFSDLFTVFGIELNADNSYLLSKRWEDVLIDNNDARVLRTLDGEPVLYYIFFDRNLFTVTTDIETIREITKRLRAEQLKI